jgi:arylsulfatase A
MSDWLNGARTSGMLFVFWCFIGVWCASSSSLAAEPRPNVVIILADDLGYGDLGCYGHPSIRTPHLDRMAREGMRFTDFYSAGEVCTPSRASLLTGRYAVRSGMANNQNRVLRRVSTGGLPAEEITLAERLKESGYSTALVGKWHLGVFSTDPNHHPRRHGFDYFFGVPHSNDMDPGTNLPPRASARLDQNPAWWNSPLYRNDELVERPADQSTLTRRYTDEAVKFIRDNKARPFFLYFAHTFPHVPLFASESFRGKSPRGLYGDVVEELDASVGTVLDALRAEGVATNTFVFFTSDNGPWLIQGRAGGSAGLLREGKGSTWEGGMRVPGIAWWPGRVPAGALTRELACNMDLFATCLKLAGLEPPRDRRIDGLDITPVLFGQGPSPRDSFMYYRGTQLYAARAGGFKAHFITQPGYGTNPPVATHSPPLLFDLGVDPGESFNIASNRADVMEKIQRIVDEHRATITPVKNQLADPPAPRRAASAIRPTNDFLFIDNGQIRLGINTNWGAGIAWFSNTRGPNLVNHWDHGRLIQQSYYGAKDGSMWDKQPWRWNPVQGGDWRGNPARVLEWRATTNTLYAKSQAKHWAAGTDLLDVIFEQWIGLTGRLAHVRFQMTYSGADSHPKTTHEIPAVFVAPEFDTLVLYDGTNTWTGDTLHRSKPGWPNESRRVTEHWAAYVDGKDWGLGVLVPAAEKLTCYRFAAGQDETKGACSYFAPTTEFAITPGMKFSYEIWLTIGYATRIRERFHNVMRETMKVAVEK